ncbi:MAG: YraN family protein [Firmicutes bacterium]|nr:YraN family protein [Bacillota bacterium]
MNNLGTHGEELAARYLQKLGFVLLERNWRCAYGEIDIIAKDGDVLVFVEVKTRRSNRFGTPTEAVHDRKQQKLRLVARHYLYEKKITAFAYRFDVAAVDGKTGTVTLIKNAF